jgi:hypothetical protein
VGNPPTLPDPAEVLDKMVKEWWPAMANSAYEENRAFMVSHIASAIDKTLAWVEKEWEDSLSHTDFRVKLHAAREGLEKREP